MSDNIHKGHRKRMMKKVLGLGFNPLEQHEILEVMLYNTIPVSDTNPIAHRLIKKFKTINGVCHASKNELLKIPGIGNKTADFLNSIPYFIQAYNYSKDTSVINLTDKNAIKDYAFSLNKSKKENAYYILCFNAKNEHCRTFPINSSIADDNTIKSVIDKILKSNCKNVIMCHIKPCGMMLPTYSEMNLISRMRNTLKEIGMCLFDYITVCGEEFTSHKEMKLHPQL